MKIIAIIIAILAIIAFGIYKNSKVGGDTPDIHGGVGYEQEHTGEEKEPCPDDLDHEDNVTHE